MNVISKTKLMGSALRIGNPDLIQRVQIWYTVISKQHFGSFGELHSKYPNADRVGDRIVFNIGSYRLIVGFNFQVNRLFFKELLTHDEYDRGAWRK